MITKQCITCGTTITKAKWEGISRWEQHKYCSLTCRPTWNKGLTKEDKRVKKYLKSSKATQFKKGQTSSIANIKWKGEEAGYHAKHMWVRYHYGKPSKCEHCETTEDRMYHWANISGEYKRERDDWLRLCVSCHKKYDITKLGDKIKKRKPKIQPIKECVICHKEFNKNTRLSRKQWEDTTMCSRACSAIYTARIKTGVKQTVKTRKLKSKRLRERWATNLEWRKRQTDRMIGNSYAKKDKEDI